MRTIYFDESGNTGPDLLSSEQPIFVLCSTDLNENESLDYLNKYFDVKREIHFKKLKQSRANQEKIIQMFHDVGSEIGERCKVSIYHKEFTITCKMLDYLVEPQLYDDGIDYYDEGMNISHANMFFYCFHGFCGEVSTKSLYKAFIDMIGEKTQKSIEDFRRSIERAKQSCVDEGFKSELFIIERSLKNIDGLLRAISKADLDPALSALIYLIQSWMEIDDSGLQIVHDRSNTIFKRKEDIDFLTNMITQSTRVGYGDVTAKYPLEIRNFEFKESENSYSVQLCDLVASSLCFISKDIETDKKDFQERLKVEMNDFPIAHNIWPSIEVGPIPNRKKQSGDINPVDFLAFQMINKRT